MDVSPNFSAATELVHNGIMAVVFALLSFLIYICGLLCSHLAAFRVATNLRLAVTEHIATLPLGYVDTFGSGKFRKIISDSTGATETYLAHQLPDKAAALATPVGLIVLLFVFDWRLGLLSLVPVLLGFLIMATMQGKSMAEKMRQYSNALANMSNEAVEYVRGIPVVKTFGQSVFSFRKFIGTIDEYEKWVISLTLTKIMYMSEHNMIVADTLTRIGSVLNASPMAESRRGKASRGRVGETLRRTFQL